MNKSDIKLITIILIIGLCCAFTIYLFHHKETNKIAKVYYDGNLIKQIDLTLKEPQQYTVTGFNGEVHIETEAGKIKVNQENSPRHLCSKQGWIQESYESIVCLPNKIVIEIEAQEQIDAVVK